MSDSENSEDFHTCQIIEEKQRLLNEIILFAPYVKYYGEFGMALILFFDFLYMQIRFEFCYSFTLIPLLIISIKQISDYIKQHRISIDDQEKDIYIQSIFNWISFILYQVILYDYIRFCLY